jgi:hypothetical protein
LQAGLKMYNVTLQGMEIIRLLRSPGPDAPTGVASLHLKKRGGARLAPTAAANLKDDQLARKPGTITITLFSMIGSSGTFRAPMWISRQSAKQCGASSSNLSKGGRSDIAERSSMITPSQLAPLLYRCFVETEPTPMVAVPDWPQLPEVTRQRWV